MTYTNLRAAAPHQQPPKGARITPPGWSVVLPRLSSALTAAFAPDRLNYAHLANRQRHVHWHVVPRYAPETVRAVGMTFRDRRPGRTFRSNKTGGVPRDVHEAIAQRTPDEISGTGMGRHVTGQCHYGKQDEMHSI